MAALLITLAVPAVGAAWLFGAHLTGAFHVQ